MNKIDSAKKEDVIKVIANAKMANPDAIIIKTNSLVTVEDEAAVKGKKVLVIEDGPTITHGSMAFGAGMVAAERLGLEVADPKPHLIGTIKDAFNKYTQLDMALPALGYSDLQLKELEEVIDEVGCDVVLSATPIDITRVIKVNKPIVRVNYVSEEIDGTPLADLVRKLISS